MELSPEQQAEVDAIIKEKFVSFVPGKEEVIIENYDGKDNTLEKLLTNWVFYFKGDTPNFIEATTFGTGYPHGFIPIRLGVSGLYEKDVKPGDTIIRNGDGYIDIR